MNISVPMVIFDEGTRLFRGGDTDMTNEAWFALNKDDAAVYGLVKKHVLKKPLNLIRLDTPEGIIMLRRLADKDHNNDVIDALGRSFRLTDRGVIRNSEAVDDKRILNFICSLKFDGFYASSLPKSESNNSMFHAEMGICDAMSKVSAGKRITVQPQAAVLQDHSYRLKQARQARQREHRRDIEGLGRRLFQ